MYGETPWGYIQEKRKNDGLSSSNSILISENEKLKKLIKKIYSKEELNDDEKKLIKSIITN